MKFWRVARILVVLAWLAAATLTWWTAPRPAGHQQALDAVARGDVVAYQFGDSWQNTAGRWFAQPSLNSNGTHDSIFAWRTADRRIFWTDTQEVVPDTSAASFGGTEYANAAAAGLAQHLDPQLQGGLTPWSTGLAVLALLLGLMFFVVVVSGPAPVLGTRWYWFWLIAGTPYALGLLFWVLREHPWSPARPDVTRDRDHGWFGLLTAVLANFVVAVVLLGLNWLLGDRWVPS